MTAYIDDCWKGTVFAIFDDENYTAYFVDVLDFYDEPLVAIVRTRSGEHFLVLLISRTGDVTEWLTVFLPDADIEKIKQGEISIKNYFVHSPILVVKLTLKMSKCIASDALLPDSIPDEYLPTDDYKPPETETP